MHDIYYTTAIGTSPFVAGAGVHPNIIAINGATMTTMAADARTHPTTMETVLPN